MSELRDAILRLKAEGKTYNEIKSILGCSKGTISYYLGVGQKEKNLNRQREARSKNRNYIRSLKHNKPCMDCGEKYPYWIMDFDHRENKEFGLGDAIGKTASMERIKNEISKCDLVCANCHRNRTHFRATLSWSESTQLLFEEMKLNGDEL